MSIVALGLLIFVAIFLWAATLFIISAASHNDELNLSKKKFVAGILIFVALITLGFAHWLGIGIDQDALATKIAEQIHSTPLKVEVDDKTLANAIVNGLHAANIGVSKPSPPEIGINQDALATKIAEQIHSTPLKVEVDDKTLANAIVNGLHAANIGVSKPSPPEIGINQDALATKIAEQIHSTPLEVKVVGNFEIIILIVLVFVLVRQGMDKTMLILTIIGIVMTIVAIVAAHFWPPSSDTNPSDTKQLVVSFENSGHNTGQAFFDASSEKPIRFNSGDDTPSREAVCAAMEILNKHGSKVAILVGSHDQQPLRRNVELRFSSNAGLAMQRAQAVRNILVEKNKTMCNSPSIETVIILSDAPLNVGAKNIGNEKLKEDRTVRIYGLAVQ